MFSCFIEAYSESAILCACKKPHEQSDQMIAYSRDRLEELEVDMATIKTLESFVLKYNILLTPMG
jgi:hypothetical protein